LPSGDPAFIILGWIKKDVSFYSRIDTMDFMDNTFH